MKTNSFRFWWLYPLTGLLLFAAWPVSPLTPLIFVAWLPLLWLERQLPNGVRFFWLSLLNLFIWNIATTWWIWNASPAGAAGAIVVNSVIMCFPLMAFRLTRQQLGNLAGYLSLPLYWMSFEYLHHTWELSWPWLTLGNVFANSPKWVQWYAYTGTTGGTLWIWLMNIVLAISFFNRQMKGRWRTVVGGFALFIVPIMASILLTPTTQPVADGNAANVVVAQPNVEPYTEKFTTPPAILVQNLLKLSATQIDSNTRLLVWPETAIPAQAWEHELQQNDIFQPIFQFLQQHPQLLLVAGIDSYKLWGTTNPQLFSARQMDNGLYYEAFNTAMGVDAQGKPALYHKSKLVPGVEALPSWLGFMSSLFDDLGGTTGTLGRSQSAMVFNSPGNPYKPAPIICYESIYSNYVTDYVRAGANILTVITNDGWWGNTPGYRQHLSMSRLRAIENRLWVARSANTGISCFINPAGEVLQPQPWDTQAAIKMTIPSSHTTTFYATHGDWMSRLAWPAAIALLLLALLKRWMPWSKKALND